MFVKFGCCKLSAPAKTKNKPTQLTSPTLPPPIWTAMGEYIAPPGIPGGRALLGRAPRGKAGWQWWGLVAGAVSWMGGWVAYSNEVYCR